MKLTEASQICKVTTENRKIQKGTKKKWQRTLFSNTNLFEYFRIFIIKNEDSRGGDKKDDYFQTRIRTSHLLNAEHKKSGAKHRLIPENH